MKPFYFLFIILIFIYGCKSKIMVDAIYFNGNIITVDAVFSKAEAFAVKDGKFTAVGSLNDILKDYDSKNKIDLHKKHVYPGLIDAHCHFLGYANDQSKCQLVGTKSFQEVLEKVSDYDRAQSPPFIFGRGWDQNDWKVKEFPNNEKLNEMFSDKPVFLKRVDGHAVLVNAVFLKLADSILRPFKNSAYIEMKDGKPTGILLDNAMDAAEKLIPVTTITAQQKAVQKAQEDCFKLGLTTVVDAGLNPEQITFIDSLQQLNILKLRVYAMVSASPENIKYLERKGKIKTPYLNVQSLKVYADGAMGSRGAKLKKEYSDKQGHQGAINISLKDFEKYALWAIQHQFQLNTHAIGDSGNAFVLNVYARYLKGKNDLRWRIEHAQVVDVSDMHLFGDYSIIPSVQPTHATSDMYWAEKRLGTDRMAGAYAYKSLLKENGWLPLGTDFPVEYLHPQYTFYAAVSRRDAALFPKDGFHIKEALTREEALRGITIWAAKANFEEHEKGSIEPGKYADFMICDENFMDDDLLKIRNSTPFQTFVNGQAVYTRN